MMSLPLVIYALPTIRLPPLIYNCRTFWNNCLIVRI